MRFKDLNEQQLLALAVSAEEEDGHIYRDFAESLRAEFPSSAELFDKMAAEEDGHRHRLIELYRSRFGDHIPLIKREDVKGFYVRRPSLYKKALRPEHAREEAELMEIQSRRFYEAAARRAADATMRQLLGDLAQEESRHETTAREINEQQNESGAVEQEHETGRRMFVLRFVQPGLAGLMDGSVSTLAPLFAAAFATSNTMATFKVGLAASVGGLGHTIPFILGNFRIALTVACLVVAVELAVISWIRKRYMDTPLLSAIFQVVVGGILVFLVGWLIGAS
jgi:rubrerythrin